MTGLPHLLTAAELATALGLPGKRDKKTKTDKPDTKRIYRWTEREHDPLPAFRVGRQLLFSSADVSAWLDRQRVGDRESAAA